MNVPRFTGPGTTPSRRRFWDQLAETIESLSKIAGKNVSVQEFPGQGTIINVDRKGAPTAVCPTGDTITVTFSGIVSCGCLTDGSLSYLGTDSGGINAGFTLTRFSSTEFHVIVPGLFNVKKWSNSDCSGPPDFDDNNDCVVYARCIEASGLWTVAIQDTVTFFFAFFASQPMTTLANESSCSPFLFTDLFHNGTAIVTF